MSRLEREIRQKLEDAKDIVLQGAQDHPTYLAQLARYRAFKELTDFADDLRKEPPSLGDPEDE